MCLLLPWGDLRNALLSPHRVVLVLHVHLEVSFLLPTLLELAIEDSFFYLKVINSFRLRFCFYRFQIFFSRAYPTVECLSVGLTGLKVLLLISLVTDIVRLVIGSELAPCLLLGLYKFQGAVFYGFLVVKVQVHAIVVLAASSLHLESEFLRIMLPWLVFK